jgi:hypothetical protein
VLPPDPPHPVAVLRRLLGGAAAVAAIILVFLVFETGRVEGRLVGLISVLLAVLGFASDLVHGAGAFARLILQGGASPTAREEAEYLEYRLARRPPPDKEILWGTRLAELYRRHLNDAGRANALLDELLTRHPDSHLLRRARGLAAPSEGR